MKVAYILHDTDEFGGANKSFMSLLTALMQKSVEPVVVLPNKRGIARKLEERGIPTLVLNYRLNIYPSKESLKDYLLWIPRLIFYRYLNAKASRQLAKHVEGYDIIHTNVSVVDIGRRAAAVKRIPHLFHFREYADKDFRMHYFPGREHFYHTVQHAICITQGIRDYHHLPSDTRVIYNGIFSDITPYYTEQQDNKRYLLYAGRLEKTKGIEDLLLAYSHSNKKLPLWIAGSAVTDEYLAYLQRLCQYLGIDKQVYFIGGRTDILPIMADARAIIIPSQHEAFGRVMAEAMFQRCLTVGRDTDGIREQFENGLKLTGAEIGLRFHDIAELTVHINTICETDDKQWGEYITRAYQTVTQLYNVETCAAAILDYYQTIINIK